MRERPDGWETELRRGLDQLTSGVSEQPPTLAQLECLVAEVQQEQRQRTLRDLAVFCACALVVVPGLLLALAGYPRYFLVWQGVMAFLLLIGAEVWRGVRRRAMR